jgi:hypothetical protein
MNQYVCLQARDEGTYLIWQNANGKRQAIFFGSSELLHG